MLQEILASKDAERSAHWLAAVHFKNSCNKYWRSRLPGCVHPRERCNGAPTSGAVPLACVLPGPPACAKPALLHPAACPVSRPGCSSLSEEEKAHLRRRLLDLVEQQDQQIAVQVGAGREVQWVPDVQAAGHAVGAALGAGPAGAANYGAGGCWRSGRLHTRSIHRQGGACEQA